MLPMGRIFFHLIVHSNRTPKIGFQYRLSLNSGQKYCRMLEHSAILLTFIKLPFSIKTFVLTILSGSLRQGFTVTPFKMWFNLHGIILYGS